MNMKLAGRAALPPVHKRADLLMGLGTGKVAYIHEILRLKAFASDGTCLLPGTHPSLCGAINNAADSTILLFRARRHQPPGPTYFRSPGASV